LTELKPDPVRLWLRDLPISPKSKRNVRGILGILWDYGMLKEIVPVGRNPMELVRIKGTKKTRTMLKDLTAEQFQALLKVLGEDVCLRTMVLVALSFGLRISEVLGLKWRDVDWLGKTLTIERGVVKQIVDDVKTEESARTMPIATDLLEVLMHWKQSSQFSSP
jgi:integrase